MQAECQGARIARRTRVRRPDRARHSNMAGRARPTAPLCKRWSRGRLAWRGCSARCESLPPMPIASLTAECHAHVEGSRRVPMIALRVEIRDPVAVVEEVADAHGQLGLRAERDAALDIERRVRRIFAKARRARRTCCRG